jgi:WD40 repeat protein
VRSDDLSAETRSTCHSGKINSVCYPYAYSEVFATCGTEDIRVWNARNCTELLRIRVPNLDCECICFTKDGKAILSGWSDGESERLNCWVAVVAVYQRRPAVWHPLRRNN